MTRFFIGTRMTRIERMMTDFLLEHGRHGFFIGTRMTQIERMMTDFFYWNTDDTD